MISICFRSPPVYNYVDAQNASSNKIYAKLFHHLLRQGIYWPPAGLESFFVSTKHTVKDLSYLSDQITKFFKGELPWQIK
jgi:glutamate-1-semialdehyde 2,1-aminomutase